MRVLSTRGVSRALGSRKLGANTAAGGAPMPPPFLAAGNLKPFISGELLARIAAPLRYQQRVGGLALGYEASLLPQMCEVILEARRANALLANQLKLATAAEPGGTARPAWRWPAPLGSAQGYGACVDGTTRRALSGSACPDLGHA